MMLSLFLVGCYSDQKQQLSACQLQTKQHTDQTQSIGVQNKETSEYIELCMGAKGYEIVQDDCPAYLRTDSLPKPNPDFYNSLSKEEKDKLNLETGKKL